MSIDQNHREMPPELRDAIDEYDRHRNVEVLGDYEQLFELLRQMHRQYPHWRFGQMITNLASWSGKTKPGNAYDVPDGRLLETARSHLAQRSATKSSPGVDQT
jgi:hypothetical protein